MSHACCDPSTRASPSDPSDLMALKLSDLPPAVRARVEEQAGIGPRARKSKAGVGDGQPCPGRCSCGATFGKYTTWENKHWPTCRGRWCIDLHSGEIERTLCGHLEET